MSKGKQQGWREAAESRKWPLGLWMAAVALSEVGGTARTTAEVVPLEILCHDAEEEIRTERRMVEDTPPSFFGALSPEYRALLDLIALAEGTDYVTGQPDVAHGYNHITGTTRFTDYRDHPQRSLRRGAFQSTAAGRYQFLKGTYQGLRKKGLFEDGFFPDEQDRAALYILQKRGVSQALLARAVQTGKFRPVFARMAQIWTPFPGGAARNYGQSPKSYRRLVRKYYGFLKAHQNNGGTERIY